MYKNEESGEIEDEDGTVEFSNLGLMMHGELYLLLGIGISELESYFVSSSFESSNLGGSSSHSNMSGLSSFKNEILLKVQPTSQKRSSRTSLINSWFFLTLSLSTHNHLKQSIVLAIFQKRKKRKTTILPINFSGTLQCQ